MTDYEQYVWNELTERYTDSIEETGETFEDYEVNARGDAEAWAEYIAERMEQEDKIRLSYDEFKYLTDCIEEFIQDVGDNAIKCMKGELKYER